MTIRHLKIFVAVCQTNSVTKAAEKLYISQPAVSLAIKELEEHYDQKIFERFARKLRITPFGQELYQSALRVVTLFDEMETSAKRDKLGNIMRVGVGPMIGQVMLPERVCKFKEKYPQVQITALVDRVIYLRNALIENRIDFAIAESVFEDPMIKIIPLLAVPLVVLAFVFANYFNIVGMGKDFSQNLGVNYNLVLFLGLTISAVITASVVTVVGQISYIGLIIPNIVAMFRGDRIKGTLTDTALLGALFVLLCDMIARTVIAPYELPIELIVGIFGSLVFIAMLVYKLKHGKKAIRLTKAKEGSCCG